MLRSDAVNCEQEKNSADILQKLFNKDIDHHPSGKLNQSISLDETKHTFNNQKLEEFKNIVESSYQNHVLNKSENDLQFSRRFSVQSTNSFQAWNFSLNSLDESFKNSSVDLFSGEKNKGIEVAKIDNVNSSVLNCKIPYMSAYNIYEEPQNSVVNKIFDGLNQTKKLTSNGSSETTSPTSLSSAGSAKNVNDVLAEDFTTNKMELKPPETPKTSNLKFRKNLFRKSLDSSNKSFKDNQTELNTVATKKSTKTTFSNNSPETSFDKFIEPKLSERKASMKKKSSNIFNYLDDLSTDSDFVQDHSDEENTLDIFSNDKETSEKKKNMNLKIDLSLLNTSDEEDNRNDYDEDTQINNEMKPLESSFSSSSRQQIKPDNIPNLVLDQIDEDRSVSVAVSLAKSMCKEIDYKKEMEAIICDEIKEYDSKVNSQQVNRAIKNGEMKKQVFLPKIGYKYAQ